MLINGSHVSSAETLKQMREDLKSAIEVLTRTDRGLVTSISSGCELFLRFITLATLDYSVSCAQFSHHLQ